MKRIFLLAILLTAAPLAASCGTRQTEADPAAVDAHLRSIDAREKSDRNQAITAARARENVREQEMEEKAANYTE